MPQNGKKASTKKKPTAKERVKKFLGVGQEPTYTTKKKKKKKPGAPYMGSGIAERGKSGALKLKNKSRDAIEKAEGSPPRRR